MKPSYLKTKKGITMKKLSVLIAGLTLIASTAFAQSKPEAPALRHGGGNGGDDIELELKKKALQIGYFIKSEVGSKVFKVLNPDSVLETVEKIDFDVVTTNLVDKYGVIRTCVNEPERSLVTCNSSKITELKKSGKSDIFTAMIFHEILGVMEIELGHQDNVSMYPISSKIIPYDAIIAATPVSESDIRPEYYGLDQRSYGITLVNKETKESVRMICLNSNVEIHRCRNYSIVRSANGLQAPLIPGIVSISPVELSKINLKRVKASDLVTAEAKLKKLQDKGYKFISLRGKYKGEYRFGVGGIQAITPNNDIVGGALFGILIGVTEFDLAVEASKQAINITIWPIKAIVNSIRLINANNQVSNLNKKIDLAHNVLNLSAELNLVGKTQEVSNEDYQTVLDIITLNVTK